MAVRPAVAGDFPALAALAQASGLAVVPARDWSGAEARVWVAEGGGPAVGAGAAPVGFLAAWAVADELQIQDVAVAAAHRRHGHGSALVQQALDAARAAGARVAVLEVRAGNQAALALYRRAGFEVARIRRAYYSAPTEDGLELILLLASPEASPPPRTSS